jgi:hypothetical protein
MIFQRQGCVLSNDYEKLSIVKTKSSYIPIFVLVALSAKGEPCHVTVVAPSTCMEPGHVTVGLGTKVGSET